MDEGKLPVVALATKALRHEEKTKKIYRCFKLDPQPQKISHTKVQRTQRNNKEFLFLKENSHPPGTKRNDTSHE
jgi:hypothetical protein